MARRYGEYSDALTASLPTGWRIEGWRGGYENGRRVKARFDLFNPAGRKVGSYDNALKACARADAEHAKAKAMARAA